MGDTMVLGEQVSFRFTREEKTNKQTNKQMNEQTNGVWVSISGPVLARQTLYHMNCLPKSLSFPVISVSPAPSFSTC